MKYIITIEEMVSQDFEVEAEDLGEALRIAEENYKKGTFVLESGNLVCKQICGEREDGEDGCYWYEF